MQDKFVGDIGDFGKYGLLTAMTSPRQPDGERKLRLGVVWYYVTADNPITGDSNTRYVDKPESFRRCDEKLFDALRDIVRSGNRRIEAVQQGGVLPRGTRYYPNPINLPNENVSAVRRLRHRGKWMRRALEKTQVCDVVFVDPDTGLDAGVRPHHKKGPKYVFFDELLPYLYRDQTLVIYQHWNREPADRQVQERILEIEGRLQTEVVRALRFRPGRTTFFIVPNRRDEKLLSRRIDSFLSGAWDKHFQLIE